MSALPDEALALRAQLGDADAERVLLERLEPLATIASRLWDGGLGLDRGDVVQAARLGILGAIRSWSPEGGATLRGWAVHAARRDVVDLLRAEGRLKHRIHHAAASIEAPAYRIEGRDEDEPTLGDLVGDERALLPFRAVEDREELAQLVGAVRSRLGPRALVALAAHLRDGGESLMAEVAAGLGMTPKAYETSLYRAGRIARGLPPPPRRPRPSKAKPRE